MYVTPVKTDSSFADWPCKLIAHTYIIAIPLPCVYNSTNMLDPYSNAVFSARKLNHLFKTAENMTYLVMFYNPDELK